MMRTCIAVTFCRSVLFALPSLGGVGLARGGDCPNLTLELSADVQPGDRAYADLAIGVGDCLGGVMTFDMEVSDPMVVDRYVCFVRCGTGWYRTSFWPTKDDVQPGKTYPVALSTADFATVEGNPDGWHKSDRVRFSAYRVLDAVDGRRSLKSSVVRISNLAFKRAERDVLVLWSPRQGKDTGFYGPLHKALGTLGIPLMALGQDDLPLVGLDGVKLVVIACALPLTRPCAEVLEVFVAKGGKVIAFDGAKAGWWRGADGKMTDIPGLAASLQGGARESESLDLFAAVIAPALPGTFERIAKAKAMASAHRSEVRRRLAAMPGKPDERRFIWCHSAWGMGEGHDWDSTCRFAKENGFTDLLANLAWGGCAYYPSKVLPRAVLGPQEDALAACLAACRKHGLKLHVWKVCWRAGADAPPSFCAKQKRKKKVCVGVDGEICPQWNCPSDPTNQRLEIAAMTELSLDKGVDGIHFDYIRYRNEKFCFCDGCRERFEKRIGRTVAKWPQDVGKGGILSEDWKRFRCENVSAVVKAVAEKVKKDRPKVEISAAVFPVPACASADRGQDWLTWCRVGWLDFVCPMDYIDRSSRFAACVQAQRDAMKGTRTRLYPGIAIECSFFGRLDVLVPALEVEEVRKAGLDGFTVFQLGQYAESVLPELRKGPLKEVK